MTEIRGTSDPMGLLRGRLAAGEISEEEFDRISQRLGDHASDLVGQPKVAQSEYLKSTEKTQNRGARDETQPSVLVRYLTGETPLWTSFAIFVVVFAVLLGNGGLIGRWWGGVAYGTGLPILLHIHLMALVGFVVAMATLINGFRSNTRYGLLVNFIVLMIAVPFLIGYIRIL